jgi:DNA polymerase I-like protein with 3'-5' exonuclease and polymerase domains
VLIVPTLHPGMLFRSGDEGFAKLEIAVREDMRKAKRLSTSVETWDESPIWEIDSVGRLRWLFPKVEDVGEFMAPLLQAMAENRYCPLSFDVETSGEHQLDCKLLCVGLGYIDPFETERMGRPVRRVCNVPLLDPGGVPYWSPHDEWVIREYLRMMLTNPYITKRCHNGAFDTVVMWAQGIPVHGWREDTMQLHHCVDSELPQNLGFVGSRFTDGRYWKDDVKGGLGWLHMDAKTLRSYNLRDVLVTIDVHEPLIREAQQLGVVHVYEQEVKLAQLMARATIRGVYVDPERRDSEALDDKGKPVGLAPQLRIQSAESLAALRQIAGPSFDPGKPVQLRWLLYDKLGLPVVKETKSGLPATDKEAFMLLDAVADADEQKAAIRSITKWRQAEKFMGTFVKGLDVLKDGRFHPSWKVLTTTGRLASSPNFQNLPGRVKKIFRSSPGYKLVGVDLSQAELRLIAYYANEKSLLEMYEKDINVHTVNASLLFKLQCPPEAADNINPQTEEYLRRAVVEQLGLPPGSYDSFPVVPKAKWKPVRTLAKNYEFGCWLKNTRIAVLDERRAVPIQNLKPGDMTWCWDGEKYAPTRIKRAWTTGVKQCVRLVVKDPTGKRKVLECTPDHRILTRAGVMCAAADLKPGDRLMPFRRWGSGYVLIDPRNDGSRVAEHRWVMGVTDPKLHVHHVDENPSNNAPENLRILTAKEHRNVHGESHAEGARRQWVRDREQLIKNLTAARVASPKWQKSIRDPEVVERRMAGIRARNAARPPMPACACGAPSLAKGLCRRCYNSEYRFKKNHEVVSVELGVVGEVWDIEVEHPAHNFALADGGVFVSNSAYGAIEETLYTVLRSKRDADSNELLFPTITLSQVQALRVIWKRLRPGLLRFWELICQSTERHRMYVCPIGGRVRRYRGGFKRNEMLNCLDDETEALTKRGWVRGFQLRPDDTLLTKNSATGRLEWERMIDLRLFPDHEGPLVEFRTKSFTAVSTPDHRWLVHDRRTGTDVCRLTADINRNGMDGIHRTGADYRPVRRCRLSDDFIELIGWALTDGCFQSLPRKRTGPRPAVTIMQSWFGNPAMVRRIDGLMKRLKLKVWRSRGDPARRGCDRWILDQKVSEFLMGLFPGRRLTHEFIAALTRAQARHLVFVMVLGDGSLGTKTTFTASSREKAELFQMLCVIAGYATSVVECRQGRTAHSPKIQPEGITATKPHYRVTILRRDKVQVLAKHRREFVGKVPVWCPIVPNTYFVARRDGHVFITGNTPIQTGVASHMNERMLVIQDIFDRETGGAALVVQQVHDALTVEAPDDYAKRAAEVLQEVLSQPFDINPVPGIDQAIPRRRAARLPADTALINDFLDKT